MRAETCSACRYFEFFYGEYSLCTAGVVPFPGPYFGCTEYEPIFLADRLAKLGLEAGEGAGGLVGKGVEAG